jgi:hypothetical protein
MPEGAKAQTFCDRRDRRDRALGTSQVVIRDDPGVELREDEQYCVPRPAVLRASSSPSGKSKLNTSGLTALICDRCSFVQTFADNQLELWDPDVGYLGQLAVPGVSHRSLD